MARLHRKDVPGRFSRMTNMRRSWRSGSGTQSARTSAGPGREARAEIGGRGIASPTDRWTTGANSAKPLRRRGARRRHVPRRRALRPSGSGTDGNCPGTHAPWACVTRATLAGDPGTRSEWTVPLILAGRGTLDRLRSAIGTERRGQDCRLRSAAVAAEPLSPGSWARASRRGAGVEWTTLARYGFCPLSRDSRHGALCRA